MDLKTITHCTSYFPAHSDEIGCTRRQIRWLVRGVRRMANVHALFGRHCIGCPSQLAYISTTSWASFEIGESRKCARLMTCSSSIFSRSTCYFQISGLYTCSDFFMYTCCAITWRCISGRGPSINILALCTGMNRNLPPHLQFTQQHIRPTSTA